MRARIVHEPSKEESEAISREIKKQLAERMRNHEDNVDAQVMYVLNQKFGFGKKRLREFYLAFQEEVSSLINHYEMPGESEYLAKAFLKEHVGVDVEAWNDEMFGKDRGNEIVCTEEIL